MPVKTQNRKQNHLTLTKAIMGRFATPARTALIERIDAECIAAEEAAGLLQSEAQHAVRERQRTIQRIRHVFGDPPAPLDWQKAIENEYFFIALEREWMEEFEQPMELLKLELPAQ